jgi:AcrR family transcriptional regulator
MGADQVLTIVEVVIIILSEHSMSSQRYLSMSVPEEPLTLRQQQAIARRRQILETALHLFAKQGFDGTSTKQIAQEAGIAEGLIFHYFPTKEHLLTAMMETHHSYRGELRGLLDGVKDRTAAEVLHQIATEALARFRREAEITLVMFSTAQTNPKVGAVLRRLIAEEGVAGLSAYLRTRIEAGELRTDLPVENSALMLYSSLVIFFFLHHSLPDGQWTERAAAFVSDLVTTWLEGARS